MEKVKDFLKRFPEIYSVPIALFVWIVSIPLLRLIDNTSAVYDAGVFQVIIFAVLQLLVYASISWLVMGLLFGTFRTYLLRELKSDFERLEKWQKICASYFIFFSLLVSLVLLSYTLN